MPAVQDGSCARECPSLAMSSVAGEARYPALWWDSGGMSVPKASSAHGYLRAAVLGGQVAASP